MRAGDTPDWSPDGTRILFHDNLDNVFIQALSQVPGVAQASIIGDQKPSIRVQVDPAKLASIGLTLEEVRDSLVKATSNAAKVVFARAHVHPRCPCRGPGNGTCFGARSNTQIRSHAPSSARVG